MTCKIFHLLSNVFQNLTLRLVFLSILSKVSGTGRRVSLSF